MKLIEVTDNATRKEFLEFPVRLYRDHPNWIRPLDNDIEAVFDPKKNKNFERGEAIRWLLTDENDPVGVAEAPELAAAVKQLSDRQQEIFRITRDIVLGKNQ